MISAPNGMDEGRLTGWAHVLWARIKEVAPTDGTPFYVPKIEGAVSRATKTSAVAVLTRHGCLQLVERRYGCKGSLYRIPKAVEPRKTRVATPRCLTWLVAELVRQAKDRPLEERAAILFRLSSEIGG